MAKLRVTRTDSRGLFPVAVAPWADSGGAGLQGAVHGTAVRFQSGTCAISPLLPVQGSRHYNRDDRHFPTRPLYSGKPCFLPAMIGYYDLRDRIDFWRG